MIDINLLRKNPDFYRKATEAKQINPETVDAVLRFDEEWRKLVQEKEKLLAERNKQIEEVNKTLQQGKETSNDIKVKSALGLDTNSKHGYTDDEVKSAINIQKIVEKKKENKKR